MTNTVDIVDLYHQTLSRDDSMSIPVAAICALTEVIHASHATTMIELSKEMEASTSNLQKSTDYSVSVTAGCELFTRFISRTHNEAQNLVNHLYLVFRNSKTFYPNFMNEASTLCQKQKRSGNVLLIWPWSLSRMELSS